jgi:hypothetical protein
VVPLDVLLIINELNNPKFRDASGRLPLPPPEGSPPPYFDVNGDAHVTPLDALIVINFINNTSNGEGEAATDQALVDLNTAIAPPIFVPDREEHELLGMQSRADNSAAGNFDVPQLGLSQPVIKSNEANARDRWFAGLADSEIELLLVIDIDDFS